MDPIQDPNRARELDRAACVALLGSQRVGRVVLPGTEPFIVPVNYVLVDELVVFRTGADSHAAAAAGTSIAFEVDAVDVASEAGWSVVISGPLEDVTEQVGAGSPLGEALESWAPGPKDRWLAVRIASISGRWVHGVDTRSGHLDDRGYL
jgi:nitroimidazol reductase NimA-like FMN-containing flavoprotein (pyridoxamine 5'-phosphate oxidase superfamily)